MRILSTGKYNCMKGTLPLLVIFLFSYPGGRKKKKNYQGECLCSICRLCIPKEARVHKYIAKAILTLGLLWCLRQ